MKKLVLSLLFFMISVILYAQTLYVPGGATSGIGNSGNGYVGIGTDNPEDKLHVNGRLKLGVHASGAGTWYVPSSGTNWFAGLNPDGNWRIYKDVNRILINPQGNVGIGTDNPEDKLHVNGRLKLGVHASGAGTWYVPSSGTNWFAGLNHDGNWRIYKDSNKILINPQGNVGIGTENPGRYKLNVWGPVRAHEVVVNTSGADFVFADNYNLPSLQQVETFIKENKHLPEIPSAAEMQENGLHLAEMNIKLLQKVEELTLYIIEQQKQMESIRSEVEMLKSKN